MIENTNAIPTKSLTLNFFEFQKRKSIFSFLIALLYFFYSGNLSVQAQSKKIDSLQQVVKSDCHDTVKLKAFQKILDVCEINDNLKYTTQAVDFIDSRLREIQDKEQRKVFLKHKADFLIYATYYYAQSSTKDEKKAVEYSFKSLEASKEMGDALNIARSYNTIGTEYNSMSKYSDALIYHKLALDSFLRHNDLKGIGNTYFLIGNVYNSKANRLSAFYYFFGSLKFYNEANIHVESRKPEDTALAIQKIQKELSSDFAVIAGFVGLLSGFLFSLSILHLFLFLFQRTNKSNIYYSLYALFSAISLFLVFLNFSYLDSDSIFLNSSIVSSVVGSLASVALLLFLYSLFFPKPPKFFMFIIGMLILYLVLYFVSNSISSVFYILFSVAAIVEVVRVVIKAKRNKLEGAGLFGIYMWISLSLFVLIFAIIVLIFINIATSKNLSGSVSYFYFLGITFCFTYLNFSIFMSVFLARQVANTNKGLKKQMDENQLLSERMLEQEIEKKKILETQNEELEVKVNERTSELLRQKEIVEVKNQEILDSINYAQRIQNALLPSLADITSAFPQSFVLYKPKDIVSGDFFWLHRSTTHHLIAAADCTGHGVPGAFMSTIGNEKLNESVLVSDDVSSILNSVNRRMKKVLHQSSNDDSTRDGMDIVLCSFNHQMTTLEYAGANRPLYIIRAPQPSNENLPSFILEEIKATKTAVGGLTEDEQDFVKHHIQLHNNDTVYLFTDGYSDQYSPEDKKLMTKKFKQILLSIQGKSMKEQQEYLNTFIEQWRGSMEQTDDILVIGIKVT